MIIHEVGASQEVLEVVVAEVDGDGEADGRPQGVPPSHPLPEPEHVSFINAKFFNLGGIGRQSYEVFSNSRILSEWKLLVTIM